MQLGYALQSGFMLYKLVSLACGLLLVATFGLVLMGQYVHASLVVCAIVALRRGVWWVLVRKERQLYE